MPWVIWNTVPYKFQEAQRGVQWVWDKGENGTFKEKSWKCKFQSKISENVGLWPHLETSKALVIGLKVKFRGDFASWSLKSFEVSGFKFSGILQSGKV